MKNIINKVGAGISVLPVLLLPATAMAQIETGLTGAVSNLEDVESNLDTPATSLPELIGGLINVFLGLLGIIFLIMVVYAGFIYMMAGGDPDKTKKAKQLITNAVIGIIIVVASYAISSYVLSAISTAAAA